jgi:hypothetical protein
MRAPLSTAIRALEQEAIHKDRHVLLPDIEHARLILQYVCDQLARLPNRATGLVEARSSQPEAPTIPRDPSGKDCC